MARAARKINSPCNSSHTKETRNTTEDQGHIALSRESRRQPGDHPVLAREVEIVVSIAGGVPRGRRPIRRTKVHEVLRDDGLLLQHRWRLDHGRRQAAVHVPFDMAVEEPDARVVSAEADHEIAHRLDYEGVTAHRYRGDNITGLGPRPVEVQCIVVASRDDLEGVSVQVERMFAAVVVVKDELDNTSVRKDEGVGEFSVDGWVCYVFCGSREGSKNCWHDWSHVGYIIEECIVGAIAEVILEVS